MRTNKTKYRALMGEVYRKYVEIANLAAERMSESHIAGLTDAFFLMDMDQDGVVTAADLRSLLSEFAHDGRRPLTVDWHEFSTIVGVGRKPSPWAAAEYARGLREGFLVFTDTVVRPGAISATGVESQDFLRKIQMGCYDEDHIDGQMSYTEFMRGIITRHHAANEIMQMVNGGRSVDCTSHASDH